MKTRTITLTDRPPVKIKDEEWPIIAEATGNSWHSNDYSRYQQAWSQGELDKYILRVRQHADGRIIVYGIYDAATAWTGHEDHRGGVLLASASLIPAAIRAVGEECGLPDSIIRDCIANLPAEEI